MAFFSAMTTRDWVAMAVISILVVMPILGLSTNWYDRWRRWRIARRITTATGLVRVTPRDIRCWSWRAHPEIARSTLPLDMQAVIRNYGNFELGRMNVDLLDPKKARDSVELRRALTISSALFGFDLPHKLILLDEMTAAYFYATLRETELVYVKPNYDQELENFHVQHSTTLTAMAMARYTGTMGILAAVVLHFAQKGHFPPFQAFAKNFNLNLKKPVKDSFKDDEIRSMVTAYAVLTRSRIPVSYIRMDEVTVAVIKNPLPVKRPVVLKVLK